jgi:hypothetical protein
MPVTSRRRSLLKLCRPSYFAGTNTSLRRPKGAFARHRGYGILRDYEVIIDYPHKRVSCYSLHTVIPATRPFIRQDSLPFTLGQGKPITTGYIGQVPVRLLLDTEAVTDDLDAAFYQTLVPASRPVLHGTDYTPGASGHRQRMQLGTLPPCARARCLAADAGASVFLCTPCQ